MAIQVCAELTEKTKTREVKGLIEAMEMCKCPGLIITLHQDEEISAGDHSIRVIPFWRWSLQEAGWNL